MGVDRTDYLMWGAKVDPDKATFAEFEAEIYGAPNRRFDLVIDDTSGAYAVAGRVIARIDRREGVEFQEITADALAYDHEVAREVSRSFPDAYRFATYLFSNWH